MPRQAIKLSGLFSAAILGVSVWTGAAFAKEPVSISTVEDLAKLATAGGEISISIKGTVEPWPLTGPYPTRTYKDGDNSPDFHVYQFTPVLQGKEQSDSKWLLYSKDVLEEGNKQVNGKLLVNTAKEGTVGSGMTLFEAENVTAAE